MAITEPAFAKINLALHVTGQRADGYHLLDSIVAFAGIGDSITVKPAPDLSLTLTLTGPFSDELSASDNLVLKAARALHPTLGAHITLDKALPVASGIGGGSADAAATIRALSRLWQMPLPDPETLLRLGADVPVCLAQRPTRMQGTGEHLSPLTLPDAHIVLANCGDPVATSEVFAELDSRADLKTRPTSPLSAIPDLPDVHALAAYLDQQRNDLEYPAMLVCPEIGQVASALSDRQGCLLARMSGSGGTCFGLFADEDSAYWAARMIGQYRKHWWVQATRLLA